MSDEIKLNADENVSLGDAPVKSEKQLEKEAKKAAKLQKLQQKIDKKTAAPPSSAKEKVEVGNLFE